MPAVGRLWPSDNDDDDYINDDADDDDAEDNDYDGDDDDSGPCPIFPIRLRRLPDHRADGTTGLMIEHPFVKDHDDDDHVDYDDDCDESYDKYNYQGPLICNGRLGG